MSTFLDRILGDVADELFSTKAKRPITDIRARLADAPPVRGFETALRSQGFSLIAEIKEKSPSVGPMREANVRDAASAYEESNAVAAISVLTNVQHFGMHIGRMASIRASVTKPVLRKDFMIDEYQVREARAFGADAILLMANVLDASRLAGFYELAMELELGVLFEVHTEDEIAMLPPGAKVVGINSRKFKSESGFVAAGGQSEKDFSLDFGAFELASRLPEGAIRVAESGLEPSRIAQVREHFQAGLVGTSLLRDERGVRACLAEFEDQICLSAHA
jgi:indole-3-glycerol phosphate synthase